MEFVLVVRFEFITANYTQTDVLLSPPATFQACVSLCTATIVTHSWVLVNIAQLTAALFGHFFQASDAAMPRRPHFTTARATFYI